MKRSRQATFGVVAAILLASGTRAVAAGDAAEDALRATFRVYQGAVSGTAFLVADAQKDRPVRHVLVTAAHVFEGMEGPKCVAVFRTKKKDGPYERRETEFLIRDGKKPLWTRHPESDVAAIAIDLPAGIDAKPFELRQIADTRFAEERRVRVGDDVFIPCFPAKLEANPVGWPILRKGSIATHPLTPLASAKTLMVDYSHFGGDSGAPVTLQAGEEPIVVALVVGMQRQSVKTVTPVEERTVHTPLDLAISVQSPLVRETIERSRKP